jgi:hypothetical protein
LTAILLGTILFGISSVAPVKAQVVSSCPVNLSTAYNYTNTVENTTIGWDNELCADSVSYFVGGDGHINFTDSSFGYAPASTNKSFGASSISANANITSIAACSISFHEYTATASPNYLRFYYLDLPSNVTVSSHTIISAMYLTNHVAYLAAPSPAVFKNATGSYLEVKSSLSDVVFNGVGCVLVTVRTNPLNLMNALTIDGTTYSVSVTFDWAIGSSHALVAAPTALSASLVKYTFSSWSQGGSATQSYTVTGSTTLTANYGAQTQTSSCDTGGLMGYLQHGGAAPDIYCFWYSVFGPWFLAFVDFIPALVVYTRTESPGAATVIYILFNIVEVTVIAGTSGFPPTLSLVAPMLLGSLIAGSVFQLMRSRKGG